MKSVVTTLLLILAAAFASCEHRNAAHQDKRNDFSEIRSSGVAATAASHDATTALWLFPEDMTPFSFLEVMKKNKAAGNTLGIITMTNDFPADWIRQEDMASLMKLIESPEKCSCFMNPLSSTIPSGNATIGGYASAFVDAYKQKRKVDFGLYACPETDKQKVADLREWWAAQKQGRR